MRVRAFRGRELHQALQAMRLELGAQAVVLQERRLSAPAWWPFGPRWEVLATDEAPKAPAPPEPPAPPASDEHAEQVEEELAELRSSLGRLVQSANLGRLPRAGKALTDCYEMLCSRGMSPELAQEVVLSTRDELSAAAQNRAEPVQAAVRRHLENTLNVRPPRPTRGDGPLAIFLVGQAGVGKTTTLVKLAARQVLFEERKVALVNADTSRAGCQAQMEALAQALELPVETLPGMQPAGLQAALADHADKDVLFVDMPGYGRRDRQQLRQMAALIKTAPRRRTFLLLSASTGLEEMHEIVRAFRPLGLDGLIVTKVDETDLAGAAVTLACQSSIPVAYLTAGRRIPEDIEPATADCLSGLIFGMPAKTASRKPARRRAGQPAAAASQQDDENDAAEKQDESAECEERREE